MGNRTCVKCGSTLTNYEYKKANKIFGWADWLEFTCVLCSYTWKEPTLDSEEKS